MSEANQPNRDQAALWNETSGPIWAEMQSVLDRVLAPFENLLVEQVNPGAGDRVLDIGCGAGATTLAMARCIGASGLCLGVDISEPLVSAARARADAEGLERAVFVQADAQTHQFEPGSFDRVISRFGVMFFEDPEAAFANIKRAARSDARLTFVAWRAPEQNPFMTTAARAAAPFLPDLKRPEPGAPGQFAFADGNRVQRILEASGWTDIETGAIDIPVNISETDLHAYVTKLGPVGLALRNADESTRIRTAEALRTAFAPYIHDGMARFTTACWLVGARAARH